MELHGSVDWRVTTGESFSLVETGDLDGILFHFHLELRMNENYLANFQRPWLLSSVSYHRWVACARCHLGVEEEVLVSTRKEHSFLPAFSPVE